MEIKERIGKLGENVGNYALDKGRLVDTTSMVSCAYPFFAFNETRFAKMGVIGSLKSRALAGTLSYSGVAYLFAKGRDLSRQTLKIKDRTTEFIQIPTDALFSAAFSGVYVPLINLVAGNGFEEAVSNSIPSATIGLVLGPGSGYIIDVGRDLTGIKECKRKLYPKIIKRRSPKFKKRLAKGIVGAAIVAMGLVYATAPNNQEESYRQNPPTLENVVVGERE